MTLYFVVFFILTAISLAPFIKQLKPLNQPLFVVGALILVFFAGLRSAGVGADDMPYWLYFKNMPDISAKLPLDRPTKFEIGYEWLTSALRWLSSHYTALFLPIAMISVGLAAYNYKRYASFISLSLLLFYVHTFIYRDMNQIRSAIAAAIGLFLIAQIATRQHLRIFVTIFLASLFHLAALCYFVVYFFSFFRFTRFRAILGLTLSLFIGSIGMTKLFVGLLPNLGQITVKLQSYSSSIHGEEIGLINATNIKNVFFMTVLLSLWPVLEKRIQYFKTLLLFMFCWVAWRLAFNDFGIFAARIGTFFGIVEVILLPAIALAFKPKLWIAVLLIFYAFLTLAANLIKLDIQGYSASVF